jgi:predicted transcriptional regulator
MGRMTIRLPDSLHRRLDELARVEGVSLNHLVVYQLSRASAARYDVRLATPQEIEADRRGWEELRRRLPPVGTSRARAALKKLSGARR